MAVNTAGVTVSTAVPEMSPEVAVMVVAPDPLAVAVASPCEPEVLETVAVEVIDDDHVTELVRSAVLKLEYVPVAANCWVWPWAIDTATGDTAMVTNTAGVTVSTAVPEMSPEVAVMVVAPDPLVVAVASPCEPEVLETVAVEVTEDDLVTDEVRLAVLKLEYVPVAANCWVWPWAIDAATGDTAILTSTAGVTVSTAVPEMSPEVAVMVVAPDPLAVAVASPCDPAVLETVAVEVIDDDHVTDELRLAVFRLE